VSQLSSVQGSPSSQSTVTPATHAPAWQASPLVQALSSLHAVPAATGVVTQPSVVSQLSAVQGLSSLHVMAAPAEQAPEPLQRSGAVQALPSVQPVPGGAKASAGQVVVLPVQLSAASQSPAAARQVVDDGAYCGTHVAEAPVLPPHVSWASQSPFGGPPHAVPAGCAASLPQVAALPVQASATSQ
jgi:hypothetical protein